MRMTVKDQSVLQKRAAAGFILRLAGARSAWTICPWADCQRRAGRKARTLGAEANQHAQASFGPKIVVFRCDAGRVDHVLIADHLAAAVLKPRHNPPGKHLADAGFLLEKGQRKDIVADLPLIAQQDHIGLFDGGKALLPGLFILILDQRHHQLLQRKAAMHVGSAAALQAKTHTPAGKYASQILPAHRCQRKVNGARIMPRRFHDGVPPLVFQHFAFHHVPIGLLIFIQWRLGIQKSVIGSNQNGGGAQLVYQGPRDLDQIIHGRFAGSRHFAAAFPAGVDHIMLDIYDLRALGQFLPLGSVHLSESIKSHGSAVMLLRFQHRFPIWRFGA